MCPFINGTWGKEVSMRRGKSILSTFMAFMLAATMCGVPAYAVTPSDSGDAAGVSQQDESSGDANGSDGSQGNESDAGQSSAADIAEDDAVEWDDSGEGSDDGIALLSDTFSEDDELFGDVHLNHDTTTWEGDVGERHLSVTVMHGLLPKTDMTDNVIFRVIVRNTSNGNLKTFDVSPAPAFFGGNSGTIDVGGLAESTYEVTVRALYMDGSPTNFADYKQTVEIGSNDVAISVSTDLNTAELMKAGIMGYGDVNHDGKVDNDDAKRIINAIEAGVAADEDSKRACNIYHQSTDGDLSNLSTFAVDLCDLQAVGEGMYCFINDSGNVKAAMESNVVSKTPRSNTSVQPDEGTVLSGCNDEDLKSLVNGDGSTVAKLAPSDKSATAITPENQVSLSIDFYQKSNAPEGEASPQVDGMVIGAPQNSDNGIVSGQVVVNPGEEDEQVIEIRENSSSRPPVLSKRPMILSAVTNTNTTAVIQPDGSIAITFDGMVAVKKITIVVSKTKKNTNLAEITSVEFLNNMEDHVAPPVMNIPTNVAAEGGAAEFTVSWSPEPNVLGYEVEYTAMKSGKLLTECTRTNKTSVKVQKFGGKEIINGTEFTVRVQSMNGDWRSGWSDPIKVTPKATKKPGAPTGVKVTGSFTSMTVSWATTKDADRYWVQYRVKARDGQADNDWINANDPKSENLLTATSLTIDGLTQGTTYQVRVCAGNELGYGGWSEIQVVTTKSIDSVDLPQYGLINTQDSDGYFLNNISTVIRYGGNKTITVDSPFPGEDTSTNVKCLMDNNTKSYVKTFDWDWGGAYPANNKGVVTTFTEPQNISMVSFAEYADEYSYKYINIGYKVVGNNNWKTSGATLTRYTAPNGRKYFIAKLPAPVMDVTAMKVAVGRAYGNQGYCSIAELRFHYDGGLEKDILGLYTDNLHLELVNDAADKIYTLQERLDTKDPKSGEYHPYRTMLQAELDAAKQLLETDGLGNVKSISNQVSAARDSGHNYGMSGLNAWQPIGVSAAADEPIVVYVGAPNASRGANAPLKLYASQQHADLSNGLIVDCGTLKVGRNEIQIPEMRGVTGDYEHGGALYVAYTGSNNNDNWALRVSGGVEIPTLSLLRSTYTTKADGTIDFYDQHDARFNAVKAYVESLEDYAGKLNDTHGASHADSDLVNVNKYSYNARKCIANHTDIMLNFMMYSLPASQVSSSLRGNTTDEKAENLLASLNSMDEVVALFYNHKGLVIGDNGGSATNVVPTQHLNIRYMQMSAGVFMYAAGNHIGVQWGSCTSPNSSVPTNDANGFRQTGQYFGWGEMHEIGHNINDSRYAVAEVTNNYFAQLAKSHGTDSSARWNVDSVYKRVTSGETGRTAGWKTQLMMYWQLHLAYDGVEKGPNLIYSTHANATSNHFYARVDSYARRPASAPAPNGIALTLSGGESQNIIRLASAAAQKDLTEFFNRWGLVANSATLEYVGQFPKEDSAVWLATDNQLNYKRNNISRTADVTAKVKGKSVVDATAKPGDNSLITIEASPAASAQLNVEDILGYEVFRTYRMQGEEYTQPIGFIKGISGSFVDDASYLGNRAVEYKVTMVDKFLNISGEALTDPLKLDGSGQIPRNDWELTTNMWSNEDEEFTGTDDDPDDCEPTLTINKIIDANSTEPYVGQSYDSKVTDENGASKDIAAEEAYVTINLGRVSQISHLRYELPSGTPNGITDYRIEISNDGETYATIDTGSFQMQDGKADVFFSNGTDPWICTFDAQYVRLVAKDRVKRAVAIGQIYLYGPSGDDVSFMDADGQVTIGKTTEDFKLQEEKDGKEAVVIPQGSIVFVGAFKGNPAYAVTLIFDEKGNIVGGTDENGETRAQHVIMAPALTDEQQKIGETSEGKFVYWIEPLDQVDWVSPVSVRAELYRVDNAFTNEGQRQTSDTLLYKMPSELPNITLSGKVTG